MQHGRWLRVRIGLNALPSPRDASRQGNCVALVCRTRGIPDERWIGSVRGTPDWRELLLLAGAGVLAGFAQFTLFEGMKRAPVSVIAPFEYTSLVWAFVLGFLIWSDLPREEVFFGAALIFGAGLMIIVSEHFRRYPERLG